MTIALVLNQSQRLTASPQMRQSLELLAMSNAALGAHLQEAAGTNPFLHLLWPRGSGAAAELPDRAEECGLVAHVEGLIPFYLPKGRPREIAVAFLEALEPSGWLGLPLAQIAAEAGCSRAEAEAVLAALQRMEPAGLFARSLRECLWLQARDAGLLGPAMSAVLDRLDLVAERDPRALADACGIEIATAMACLARIRAMNPKPGAAFGPADATLARAPDLQVTRVRGAWTVALTRGDLPAVRVRDPGPDAALAPELGAALRAASWLKRAVEERGRTTLAVASEIVRRQEPFLTAGRAALRPLSQREVADTLSLHESTVSRVVAGLTMETPCGLFAVKTLFAAACSTDRDGPSQPGRMAEIAALIRGEDPAQPLSDAAIAARLAATGAPLARRTVTKYREALGLPPAQVRRRAPPSAPGLRPDPAGHTIERRGRRHV